MLRGELSSIRDALAELLYEGEGKEATKLKSKEARGVENIYIQIHEILRHLLEIS